jgi:hypothetical protein
VTLVLKYIWVKVQIYKPQDIYNVDIHPDF